MKPEIALRNVEGWMHKSIGPPQQIELSITNKCNLRCIFCNEHSGNKSHSRELPLSEFLRLVGEAAEMGVREIHLGGGGEPFYRPGKALTIMKAIKQHGMWGSVTTNGLISEAVVKKIVRMGWDHIVMSLDGPDKESHDFMRDARGLFERTVSTLRSFRYWKEHLHSAEPEVHINMILSNRTHTKIAGMFRLARGLGVTRVNLLPLIEHTPDSQAVSMTPRHMQEFREHAPEARAVGQRLGVESNIDDLMDGELVEKQMEIDSVILADAGGVHGSRQVPDFSRIPCYFPWAHLVIHASGHVKPCINREAVSFVNSRSLREIWEKDPHLEEIRSRMLEGKLYRMCRTCCAPNVGKNREVREAARLQQSSTPQAI